MRDGILFCPLFHTLIAHIIDIEDEKWNLSICVNQEK
jgi:hypothetical protein